MTDIVICSLPALSVDRPPAAPALLVSAVKEAGYSAQSLDLSLEFFINQCDKNIDVYHKLASVFTPYEIPEPEPIQAANEWVEQSIDLLKTLNPKIIGISVFTIYQHRATILLTQAIRKHLPNTKIVLGGFGLIINSNSLSNMIDIKKIDLLKPFNQYVTEKKLADHNIFDNVFDNLIALLEEVIGVSETTKKLNFEEGKTLFNTPIPDYDNYKLSEYIWNDGQALPITGSKGCVRSCTFCDVPGQFGRFKYRSGEDIAKEMITLKTKYNIRTFEFTDSLVNGANKAFKEWLTIVADYNDNQPEEEKIRWFGQYICKPQTSQPSDIYSLIARSGVTSLVIGVESGSDDVLEAMQKKMTVKDVFDELEQFQRYGIKANFLMLSGYFNETWERYLQTLEFLIKCQSYIINGVIEKISVGIPLIINEKMALGINADHYGIIVDPYDISNWKLKDDPSNDLVERSRRRLITQLVLDKLGVAQNMLSIQNTYQMLDNLKRYEAEMIAGQEIVDYDYDRNLDFLIPDEIISLLQTNRFDLEITLIPFKINNRYPKIKITVDNQILVDKELIQEETFYYSADFDVDKNIKVDIQFYGKNNNDTSVSPAGEILENQGIRISKVIVNNVDIIGSKIIYNLGNYCFNLSAEKFEYYKLHGHETGPTHSLSMFENGYWRLDFKMPVLQQFTKFRSAHEKHVKSWPDNYVYNDIYNTVLNIRRLEKLTN